MRNYYICDNYLEIGYARKYVEVNKNGYDSRKNTINGASFLTLEQFLKEEVSLYWNVVSDKSLKPKIISYNTSILILSSIIEYRRNIDHYFSMINARSTVLASKIFSICKKSYQVNIPPEEICRRISIVKRRTNETLYNDIKNVIVEYYEILDRLECIDSSKLYFYYRMILSNKIYINNLRDISLTYFYNSDKNLLDFKSMYVRSLDKSLNIKKVDISANIISIFNKKLGYEYKNKDFNEEIALNSADEISMQSQYRDMISYSFEEDNIFDMFSRFEKEIYSEIESGSSSKDICICVDSYRPYYRKKFLEIGKRIDKPIFYGKNSISDSGNITVQSLISLYYFYRKETGKADEYKFSQKDDDIQLIANVFGVDKVEVRLEYDKYIKKLEDKISEEINLFEGTKLTPSSFIKYFFKKYFLYEEELVKILNSAIDLIKDMEILEDSPIVDFNIKEAINILKNNISVHYSKDILYERYINGDILCLDIDTLADLGIEFKLIYVLDSLSKKMDVQIENEIDSNLAYLDDDYIAGIIDGKYQYSDFVDEYVFDSSRLKHSTLKKYSTKIVYISSLKSIKGFNQSNVFSKKYF